MTIKECWRKDIPEGGGLTVAAEVNHCLDVYSRGVRDGAKGAGNVDGYECEIRASVVLEAKTLVEDKLDHLCCDSLDHEDRAETLDFIIRLVTAIHDEKRKPWRSQAAILASIQKLH